MIPTSAACHSLSSALRHVLLTVSTLERLLRWENRAVSEDNREAEGGKLVGTSVLPEWTFDLFRTAPTFSGQNT